MGIDLLHKNFDGMKKMVEDLTKTVNTLKPKPTKKKDDLVKIDIT